MRGVTPHETADRAQQPTAGGRISLLHFVVIGVQLGLLTLVVRQFAIESQAFAQILLLTCAGFALHAFLPLRHRLPFFGVLAKADLLEEEDLNKVLRWSQDPFALYEALTDDKSEPGTVKVVLDSEFLRAMEEMGLYRKLVPVSATLPFGLEEVYSLLQQAFEGGEDLRPD